MSKKYKILLIEDNKIDQLAFIRYVEGEKLPYEYTIADCVENARQILSKERFEIIISDYSLGDGTGFDVLDIINDTPLIFVTGAGDEELVTKAYKAGACDYLIKDLERGYLKTLPITVENAIEHKKTQDQNRLLSGAIMSTEDAVYITDLENKIIFVNKAFCKAYGYDENDVLGKDSQILWGDINNQIHTRSVFQTSNNKQMKFYHRKKNGDILPVSLSRAFVKDSKGKNIAVVRVAHDITEQIMLEEELKKLKRKIEKQNNSSVTCN